MLSNFHAITFFQKTDWKVEGWCFTSSTAISLHHKKLNLFPFWSASNSRWKKINFRIWRGYFQVFPSYPFLWWHIVYMLFKEMSSIVTQSVKVDINKQQFYCFQLLNPSFPIFWTEVPGDILLAQYTFQPMGFLWRTK